MQFVIAVLVFFSLIEVFLSEEEHIESKRRLGHNGGGYDYKGGAAYGYASPPEMYGNVGQYGTSKEGIGMASPFLIEQDFYAGVPFAAEGYHGGGILSRLENLKIKTAEADLLKAEAKAIRKNKLKNKEYFTPPPAFPTYMPQMVAVPEVIPQPIIIPISLGSNAPAAQVEPIVIETVIEPPAQSESSIGKELLLEKIREKLEEKRSQRPTPPPYILEDDFLPTYPAEPFAIEGNHNQNNGIIYNENNNSYDGKTYNHNNGVNYNENNNACNGKTYNHNNGINYNENNNAYNGKTYNHNNLYTVSSGSQFSSTSRNRYTPPIRTYSSGQYGV